MRLDDQRESSNIEDRRGAGGGLPMGRKGVGIGTIAIALVVSYFTGISPATLLNIAGTFQGGGGDQVVVAQKPPANDEMARFTSKVLSSTEDAWRDIFQQSGRTYQDPKLVLFTGATPTACGTGQSAMGPFYCPGDHKVYIDLAFFKDLKNRFKAPGEFAQAYVIAHEVGHHVQNLLGTSQKVEMARRKARSEAEANGYSVRLELQADCYAGVWGMRTETMKKVLEPGELEQALTAASAIGDDRLQSQARGYVVPESFTHGSSEQRVRWFKRGFETGDPSQCDTFSTRSL